MFFRNTIKELKSDTRELNKRIEQLECPHPPEEQELKKGNGCCYYGMRVCNVCGKIMDRYTGYESFMFAQNQHMQEQIKRHKARFGIK